MIGRRWFAFGIALLLPLLGLGLLVARPELDFVWEHHPSHFWLVLGTAAVSVALAYLTNEAASRHADARIFLVSLAFLLSAGFLGLHALATPSVVLDAANGGFTLATPVGLVAAGLFAAASAVEYGLEASLKIVRHARTLLALVLAVLAAWAIVSLAGLPPLDAAVTPDQVELPLGIFAAFGVGLYGYASLNYFRLWTRRRTRLLFAVAFAFALLAEALIVAIASLPTSWRLSWWEWHILMAIAFFAIAAAASLEWYEERFSALYLDETLAGRREVSVLFADLKGFTPFSEANGPEQVHRMLVAYFGELAPMITGEFKGEVQDFVGDQIFAIFNKRGDQPEHALIAARAALELQRRAEAIREPEWPRFRAAVNTGPVLAGVVGDRGHRIHGVFGDTVNLGARLEGQAPPGGVVIGSATLAGLPEGAHVTALPEMHVKGKSQPVQAYVLHGLTRP